MANTGHQLFRTRLCVSIGAIVLVPGCAPRLIDLRSDGPPSVSAEPDQLLDVVISARDGCDPLPVRRERVVFEGLRDTLDRSITAVAQAWDRRQSPGRADGWEILVEPMRCDSEAGAANLTVEIEVRVTARTRVGRVHLGQTQAFCRESGANDVDDGRRVLFLCVDRMARDISGWLDNLSQ